MLDLRHQHSSDRIGRVIVGVLAVVHGFNFRSGYINDLVNWYLLLLSLARSIKV